MPCTDSSAGLFIGGAACLPSFRKSRHDPPLPLLHLRHLHIDPHDHLSVQKDGDCLCAVITYERPELHIFHKNPINLINLLPLLYFTY